MEFNLHNKITSPKAQCLKLTVPYFHKKINLITDVCPWSMSTASTGMILENR